MEQTHQFLRGETIISMSHVQWLYKRLQKGKPPFSYGFSYDVPMGFPTRWCPPSYRVVYTPINYIDTVHLR